MTTALLFAGGTGRRMNSRSKPKQFLSLHGKPIIIYTIEHFEDHPEIDNIVIVCLESWISELRNFIEMYGIKKVTAIVPGGNTGHDSIYNGLMAMKDNCKANDIVLIHDGVRPLITEELISENIATVKKCGNAITSEPARESVVVSNDGSVIDTVPDRSHMFVAKAPQSFYFGAIEQLYERAHEEGIQSIDSAHLLSMYGVKMNLIRSTPNNLKITEPADYYIFRALYEALENQQVFGI